MAFPLANSFQTQWRQVSVHRPFVSCATRQLNILRRDLMMFGQWPVASQAMTLFASVRVQVCLVCFHGVIRIHSSKYQLLKI